MKKEEAIIRDIQENTVSLVQTACLSALVAPKSTKHLLEFSNSPILMWQDENLRLKQQVADLEKKVEDIPKLQTKIKALKTRIEELEHATSPTSEHHMKMDTLDISDDRFFEMIKMELEDSQEEE